MMWISSLWSFALVNLPIYFQVSTIYFMMQSLNKKLSLQHGIYEKFSSMKLIFSPS
jgi:hypothetical protein